MGRQSLYKSTRGKGSLVDLKKCESIIRRQTYTFRVLSKAKREGHDPHALIGRDSTLWPQFLTNRQREIIFGSDYQRIVGKE